VDSLDTRLHVLLHRPEPTIADEGFSDSVLHALPAAKSVSRAKAGRWTLASAAAVGIFLSALIGAPLENAFSALAWAGGFAVSMATALFVAMIAVPAAWVFYSE
jgi:hypothetical protein